MTLLFQNHCHEYEVEAVCKLFFGTMLFDRDRDRDPISAEDVIVTTVSGNTLSALVREGDRVTEDRMTMNTSIAPTDQECERLLCAVLYRVLCTHTGITPPWGMMTGIRPVKQYQYLLEQGKTEEEASRIFTDQYFVSQEKVALCQEILAIQTPIIDVSTSQSYSLYVSIPFCPTRCSYCSFVSSAISAPKALALMDAYLPLLCEELVLIADMAKNAALTLETVYIGGGTPTTLSAEGLCTLLQCIADHFPLQTAKEFTVEAGRADTITEEKLEVLKGFGVSRVSINPQTFNDTVLEAIGRKHTAAEAIDCYKLAQAIGFRDINMDLIAGLPKDDLTSFQASVDKAIALDPSNITIHTLTIKRSSDLFEGEEVQAGAVADMVAYAYDRLTKAGYRPYYLYRQKNTLDNLENIGYAKVGAEGLYNIYIMEEIHSILAAGAGAVSKLIRNRSQKVARIFNYKYPFEYQKGFEEMKRRKEEIAQFYQRNENC